MAKRLVLCCDGTWNRPDETREGIPAPTNVAKIEMAVARQDGPGTQQLVHYEEGVGTQRFERIRGGAFGYGLTRNILNCYRWLVENYEPGDELFFFGFSRGAYTARSTVGLVRNAGILEHQHIDQIKAAYRLYRDPDKEKEPRGIAATIFRRQFSHPDTTIRFIGVWDTVGALGIPIDGKRLPLLTNHWTFHDVTLSSKVLFAYHALAIDEKRGPFKPALWEKKEDVPGQTVEQVWFAGVHSDVGGGYADPSLSEIPLLWMVDKARGCGLEFDTGHFVKRMPPDEKRRHLGEDVAPNPLADPNESRKRFYLLFPRFERKLKADWTAVASSATRRRRDRSDYHPQNLDDYLRERPTEVKTDY
jgi:uncharacterized protein (DUF2235 family)